MPTWMYLPIFFAFAGAIMLAVDLIDRHEHRCYWCQHRSTAKHRGWR
jgi:hypothetical protein